MIDLFNPEFRDLQYVRRWGIVRTTRDQSVAEHSYYVTLYARQIAAKFFPKWSYGEGLLMAALLHDMSEIHTGDLPAGVKRDKNLIVNGVSDYSEMWMNPHSKKIIKVADCLEAMIFIQEEKVMGNKTVKEVEIDVKENLDRSIEDLSDGPDMLAAMFDWAQETIDAHTYYRGRRR